VSSFFKAIDEKGGLAKKWDLIKVAGNEAAFKRWVEDFLMALSKKSAREAKHYTRRRREDKAFNLYLKTTTILWLLDELWEENYVAS